MNSHHYQSNKNLVTIPTEANSNNAAEYLADQVLKGKAFASPSIGMSISRSSVQQIASPGPGQYNTPANVNQSIKDTGDRGLYMERKNGQMVIRRQPMNKFNYVHGRSGLQGSGQAGGSSGNNLIPTVVVQPTLKHNPSAVVLSNINPSPTPDKQQHLKINHSLKHLVRTPGHG